VSIEVGIVVAGAVVGFVVGLTGMGGGALMTPMLVLVFDVDPLVAVSTDVVAAVVIKPIGGGVHLRHGNVNRHLVRWLVAGSVPAAFLGVLLLRQIDDRWSADEPIAVVLGIALVVSSTALVVKAVIQLRRGRPVAHDVAVRPWPTLAIGVLGGLIVGMTSVGSGSLMMVLLLMLYPAMRSSELVGTDLVQAVPLVASAAVGHLLFGEFDPGIAGALLIGAVPAVYIGARVSAQAPDRVVRPILILVLLGTGLELLGAPLGLTLVVVVVAAITGFFTYRVLKAHQPPPATDPTATPTAT
jgi:uncharacterized membrane protein YfcA